MFKVCLVSFVQLGHDVGKEALDGLCQLWPDPDPGTWDMIQQMTDLLHQSHMTPCICFHPIYSQYPIPPSVPNPPLPLLHYPSSSSSSSSYLFCMIVFVYSLKALPLLLLLQCFFLLPNSHPPPLSVSSSPSSSLPLLVFLYSSTLLYNTISNSRPFWRDWAKVSTRCRWALSNASPLGSDELIF